MKKNVKKYVCIICDYNSNNSYDYDKHITTRKHIFLTTNAKNNTKHYSCINCDFYTSKTYDYNKHILTRKHAFLTNFDQTNNMYNCNLCEFSTPSKQEYEKHFIQNIHISNKDKHVCNYCNKIYKSRQSLWYHKTKCGVNNNNINNNHNNISSAPHVNENINKDSNIIINNAIFMELLKQNQEFKEIMLEQNSKIIELTNRENNIITTNNTTNNNNFNLNIFLNEKCKDAINLKEFIESIDISNEDLEYVGNHGYVIGFTQKLLNELKQLDVYKRPIHCTDIKREVIHVKEDDIWEKDSGEHEKMRQMIDSVAYKGFRNIAKWQKEHPESEILDSQDYKRWIEITKHVLNAENKNKNKKTEEILKNIAKYVYVDKMKETNEKE